LYLVHETVSKHSVNDAEMTAKSRRITKPGTILLAEWR